MPSPNNVLTADSYVQDGLVFQLDGIEYGGVDGQWIDRVGGLIFDTGTIQHASLGFNFDGRRLMPSSGSLVTKESFLYEVSYKYEETQPYMVIYSNPNSTPYSIGLSGGVYGVFGSPSSAPVWRLPGSVVTLSKKVSSCIANGENCQKAHRDALNVGTVFCVGGRNTNVPYYFKGYIYAIRIYSRQLSDREILINQKIDNARFQLGLDIPDEVLPATRSLSLSEPFKLPDESMTEQDISNENSDER